MKKAKWYFRNDFANKTTIKKKNGICNIHARFTSLSNLMLVFRGKSTEQQNFSFIFIPIWPTSKLQAVYLFLKRFRVFT